MAKGMDAERAAVRMTVDERIDHERLKRMTDDFAASGFPFDLGWGSNGFSCMVRTMDGRKNKRFYISSK